MLDVRILGRMPYLEALALQEELVEARRRDAVSDTLLLVEHEPVFTAGRATTQESLPTDSSIPIVEISRGGNITYHGPGQLVGYWIRKLDGADRDLHGHLRTIEARLIAILAGWSVAARREVGRTGVWVEAKKIASIGTAVRNWVSFHGFALNVAVDHAIYERFRPCGLDGSMMTDLSTVLGRPIEFGEVAEATRRTFGKSG